MAELYAGIDLGGTTLIGALAGADGEVVAEKSIPTESHRGPQAVLQSAAELINDLAESAGVRVAAAGMGVPGLVDLRAGITKFLPNLPTQWRDVAVRKILSPLIGCDVFLLNDVRTATLGELTFGHGKHSDTMLFFALGTGIGGGVVVNRTLRLGPLGAAGELGHQTILPDGPRCGCGNRGCLEALASGPAIVAEGVRLMLSGQAPELQRIVAGDSGKVTTKTMAQAAIRGDERVKEAITRAAEYLGIGVANAVTALHPDLVVLGGGVSAMGELLFDPVRKTVAKRVKMFPVSDIGIELSALGDRAGVLGAVALAVQGGLRGND